MRKNIRIALFLFFVIGITTCIILGSNVNAEGNNLSGRTIKYLSQKSLHVHEKDDWIYVFEIYYPEDNQDKIMYLFDGYNLKYEKMDDYYIPLINKETGEEIDKIIPNYITLSISKQYKEDIRNITSFFNLKQFTKPITLKDLDDLKTKNIDKNYLVNIFNNAMNSTIKNTPGKYIDKSFLDRVNVESSNTNLNGKWQLSYLIDFGYISEVNIEFISDDGEYILSDSNVQNTLTYKKIFEEINLIEKSIIENQSFDISESIKNINSIDSNDVSINNDLIELLSKANENLLNQ